jgi:predicted transport protein
MTHTLYLSATCLSVSHMGRRFENHALSRHATKARGKLAQAALYEKFETFALSLGDDVVKNERSLYFAFRRLKNFACVEVHPSSKNLLVYLKLDPEFVDLLEGFSRDVSKIGHFGTGDLELRISNTANWPLVEELTRQSYAAN